MINVRREESWYDDTQVCLNGHRTTGSLSISPERASAYCEDCGAATLENCENGNEQIRGHYNVPGVVSFVPYPHLHFVSNVVLHSHGP